MNATVQTAVQTALPTVAVVSGTLPVIAETPTEAASVAIAMAALAEVTEGLRRIVKDAKSLESDIAATLMRAWQAAGPGNAKQFKSILGDCEAAIVREEKVEKWADLGTEARSYITYKSHYVAYITELKASCPDNVDPVTLRRQVSRWYSDQRTAKGATAPKKPQSGDKPPVVQTGETEADGTPNVAVVGMSKTNIRAKGPDGKFETIEVNFPTEVIGALTRLHKQIGAALNDKVPVQHIVEALKVAHDMLGPDAPAKKK